MTDWRDLPPLTAMKAFAAFAETGAVARAGDAIGVSHAAISQQIRALAAHTGLSLVSREGRDLVLTPQGRRLADAALAGFAEMAGVVRELTGADADRPLQITTTPTFAAGWLMPRLADFRGRNPGIDLIIDPTPALRPIGPDGADIAIRYGKGEWPGLDVRLLLQSSVVVVASPGLVAPKPGICLADLADYPWLQELGTTETTAFLQKHGVERGGRHGMTSFPGNMVIDAARNGQGVAVLARAFVEADLAAGRLHVLVEDTEREGYFILTRPGVMRAPVKAFLTWALRQVDAKNLAGS